MTTNRSSKSGYLSTPVLFCLAVALLGSTGCGGSKSQTLTTPTAKNPTVADSTVKAPTVKEPAAVTPTAATPAVAAPTTQTATAAEQEAARQKEQAIAAATQELTSAQATLSEQQALITEAELQRAKLQSQLAAARGKPNETELRRMLETLDKALADKAAKVKELQNVVGKLKLALDKLKGGGTLLQTPN